MIIGVLFFVFCVYAIEQTSDTYISGMFDDMEIISLNERIVKLETDVQIIGIFMIISLLAHVCVFIMLQCLWDKKNKV